MNFLTNILAITGQQSWELLAWTMCYFLAAGTVVALAGALLRLLCKRLAPQIRYTTSLAVFAILAALPFGIALWLSPSMPVAIAPTPIVIDLAGTPITMSPVEEPIEFTNLTIAEAQTPDAVSIVIALARQKDRGLVERAIEFLPWLWLIGTPLTFLLLATGLIGSSRLRRQCTLLTEGPIIKTCERLRSTLAVSQCVAVAINERIASPLLIGIMRPMILLPPAALTGWTPEQLEMVLLHELAHVRRWDNLVNFGQRLVESLLFFHPAVWWVSRWVRRNREECCDAVVVARTAKPQAYAELLVTLATPAPPLAGLAMAQHPLTGRIRRILHLEEEKMLITRSTLSLVGLFFAAILAIALWQPSTPTLAQETNTPVAPGSAGGLPKVKATEEKENAAEKKEMQLIPFVVNIPEHRQDESNYRPWMSILEEQGFKSSIHREDNEDGKYVKHELIIEVPVGSNPRVVWEGYSDGKRPQMRPRIILSNSPTASNYTSTPSRSGVYPGTAQQQSGRGRDVPASNPPSPFPTLEAQRSADLAYKLLHVELEPLNKEEIARVKAMKFAGGLRVTSGKLSQLGPLLHYGDLLVGLHVWPTTSLADIKKVLERDDLQDLSPLKFYVIRKVRVSVRNGGGYGGEMGGYGGEMGGYRAEPKTVDQLVTGRIEVDIEAMKKNAPGPDGIMVPVTRYSPPQPVYFPRNPHTPGVITPYPESIPNIVIGQPIDPSEIPGLSIQPPQLNPTLLYDGKGFGTWKHLWRRDLSIDLRVKAVRAFVAFANAGKGKEAVDEIMAIVAEYDWTAIGINGVTDPLKHACVAAFTERQLPIDVAVEVVITAKDSKSDRARAFLPYVIEPLSRIDKETNKRLQKAFPEMKLLTIEELRAKWHGFGLGGGGGSPAPTK